MSKFDSGSSVPAEGCPQAEDHAPRLEETDFVVRLLRISPAQRPVESTGSGQVVNTKGDNADSLFHVLMIAPRCDIQ